MANRKTRILAVEDELVSRKKLVAYLQKENFEVFEAEDGASMRKIMDEYPVDLVLLDINLPDGDGIDLARQLRANSNIGIILVTGRTDEVDRIIGIEVGADDYITKPYNPRELLARIKALIRRFPTEQEKKTQQTGGGILKFGDWQLDKLRRQLHGTNGTTIKLTRAEFELLQTFVTRPGIVLSRDTLMDQIYHRHWAPSDRSIDVLVGRLRKILEADPKQPALIVTAHGEGYVFAEKVSSM
ncbi:response regulator [Polycladidibacter stylochi]|uniref:response regulator n=1 Tax=Polycladidibacter stylochi TaxID=1807766 RepID=UPI000834354F|nr:response regulator [Pseudovibrio stylochi]